MTGQWRLGALKFAISKKGMEETRAAPPVGKHHTGGTERRELQKKGEELGREKVRVGKDILISKALHFYESKV